MNKKVNLFLVTITLLVFLTSTVVFAAGLNKTSIAIYTGKTYTLKVSGTKIKSVATANKKVATISKKGIVKGVKAGTTTVAIKGTNKKVYKCKVKVVNPYINTKSKAIYTGKSYTLKLKGTTIQKVASANKKIVTISKNGVIKGIKAGNTYVSIKGTNNKTYRCKIKVVDPYINKTNISLYKGKTYTLKLAGTTIKKVSTSNAKVATISSKGVVKAIEEGKAYVSLKGANNKVYKCNVTVKVPEKPKEEKEEEKEESKDENKDEILKDDVIFTLTYTLKDSKAKSSAVRIKENSKTESFKTVEELKKVTANNSNLLTATLVMNIEKDTEKQDLSGLFENDANLTKVDLAGIKETYVSDAKDMFKNSAKIESVTITKEFKEMLKENKIDTALKNEVYNVANESNEFNDSNTSSSSSSSSGSNGSNIGHKHSYSSSVTKEATCTETGIMTYSCGCGSSYTSVIPVDANNHKDIITTTNINPTCTTPGKTIFICKCGESYVGNITPININNHKYVCEILKEATCIEKGEKKFTCECGDNYTEEIAINTFNHDFTNNNKCGRCEYKYIVKTLEEYSWTEIAQISESGIARKYFKIGDEKTIKIGENNYTVVILGFDHDAVINENYQIIGQAGITFGLKGILQDDYIMHETDEDEFVLEDYPARDIIWNLDNIYNLLPNELKEDGIIKTIEKEYEYTANNIVKRLGYCSVKLFLPSLNEILVDTSNIEHTVLGNTYEYYKDNSVIKDRAWWVRNLHVTADGTSNGYYAIDTDGNVVLKKGDEEGISISFAFCI